MQGAKALTILHVKCKALMFGKQSGADTMMCCLRHTSKLLLIGAVLLLVMRPANADEYSWIGAAYWDTLNRANVKMGVAKQDPYEPDESRPFHFGGFKYADFEVGWEGYKFAIGNGLNNRHGIDRIGLSYAAMRTQNLLGVEAVMSNMGLSVKMGYYRGLDGTDNRWLLGMGFGF